MMTKAEKAQALISKLIKNGELKRPSICEFCQGTAKRIEAAHTNYDRPRDIKWLCVPCHRRYDSRLPKGATYSNRHLTIRITNDLKDQLSEYGINIGIVAREALAKALEAVKEVKHGHSKKHK